MTSLFRSTEEEKLDSDWTAGIHQQRKMAEVVELQKLKVGRIKNTFFLTLGEFLCGGNDEVSIYTGTS